MQPKLQALGLVLSLILSSLALSTAHAYPDRPITLIVPTVPGGAGDTVSRVLADDMAKTLGQPIIVENRPGAGGVVGTKTASHAHADGYTLLLGLDSALTVSPYLLSEPPYQAQSAFSPIGQIGAVQFMLVAAPNSGIENIESLLKQAKAQPDQLSYASGGVGSVHHLAMELFEKAATIELQHIPYKAAPQGFSDLMGGHVSVMFIANGTGEPAAASKKVIALGSASANKLNDLPLISTVVPGYSFESWFGLFAPTGTPPAILEQVSQSLKKSLNNPDVAEKLKTAGVIPSWSDGQTLSKRLASDTKTYSGLMQKLKDAKN